MSGDSIHGLLTLSDYLNYSENTSQTFTLFDIVFHDFKMLNGSVSKHVT